MTILVHSTRSAARPRLAGRRLVPRLLGLARTALGWPMRVHANRRLLGQMAGMSAHELADIGLTTADVQDTAALPLHAEIGHFLAARAAARRRT
jgi:uncharacterized protein YjiS (DUF1127 family)